MKQNKFTPEEVIELFKSKIKKNLLKIFPK